MSGLAPEFDLLRTDWPLLVATDAPIARKLNVSAAFDGAAIAQVAVAGERHIQDALFAAFAMFRQKDRWLTPARRIEVLNAATRIIATNKDLFEREAARESGKPLRACGLELDQVLECARITIDTVDTESNRPTDAAGRGVHRVAEPLGVVVAVLGVSSPLEVAARMLFAAVAAGTPIIIKPAQHTPLCCLRLVQLLHEAGLPHVFAQCVVTETHELVEQLATDPRVALLSFTGSATVGWALRAKLPPGTRCVLDHPSVAPALVATDADWTVALDAIIADAFVANVGGGESVQRVYVQNQRAEEFCQALAQRLMQLSVGDPLRADSDVGAPARPDDVARLQEWVNSAVAGGARCIVGGHSLAAQEGVAAGPGGCFAPTVLLDPPIDALLSTQPIGGPVLAVYAVADMAAACERANALPYARSAAVFTESESIATALSHTLDASRVVINGQLGASADHQRTNGLRRSGLGASGVVTLIQAMRNNKSIVRALTVEDPAETDGRKDNNAPQ